MAKATSMRLDKTVQQPAKARRWTAMDRRNNFIGWLFVAPTVIYFLIFFVYPAFAALFYSFTQWDMQSDPVWAGLQNYQQLFFDRVNFPFFWHSLGVTFLYMVISIPLSLLTAFTLALMINSLRRGQDFFKVIFYLPVITTEVAVATIWGWLYDPLFGLLNILLKPLGVPPQTWLYQPNTALPALAVISAWQCGGALIIFLAGLKGISAEIYEAAGIDGANYWQKLRFVTFPLLKPTTFYLLVTGQIAGFQIFGIVYVLYAARGGNVGGPQQVGLTYVLELYNHAFTYSQMGPACAMSMILFAIIMVFTLVQFRFLPQSYE